MSTISNRARLDHLRPGAHPAAAGTVAAPGAAPVARFGALSC
ncbi:hypothetical protein [Nocardia sp. BMG51109]|nr:hypothetical protein [Nocardia sp. BMG51109]